jgi:hypothetical protein
MAGDGSWEKRRVITLPHPNDFPRGVYILPVRIGDPSRDVDLALRQFGQPPFDRHYRLLFTMDELRGSGEIVLVAQPDPLATGLVWKGGRAVPMPNRNR